MEANDKQTENLEISIKKSKNEPEIPYTKPAYISIKNWSEDERPREKLAKKGAESLSNSELIAILIANGIKGKDYSLSAIDIAKAILKECNNDLYALGRMSIKQMTKIEGIGPAKAITLAAAIELGGRRQQFEVKEKKKIMSSRDLFDYFQPLASHLNHECFWVLFLNRANKIITEEKIGEGGVSGTVADPKKIFKKALEHQASSIICCHNHPSGNLVPSDADNQLTKKIKEGGKMLDINLLDHIIIGQNNYFSYADEGML